MKKRPSKFKFPMIIEKDEDGYFAFCQELQGCYTQGETYEEAFQNIRDAFKGHIEESLANGEPISRTVEISFTTLEYLSRKRTIPRIQRNQSAFAQLVETFFPSGA